MLTFSLLLLSSILSTEPTAGLGLSRSGTSLSDDDILKALAILLAEAEGGEGRQGRSEGLGEEDRQGQGLPVNQEDFEALDGECTTTGYEVRTREECEEINEIKCETINVTKHRNEIVPKCQTLVDQKCNVTHIEVPTQQCKQRHKNRCETVYKVVEDKEYREECKVDVQHVCEHHIPVPVEVPYPYHVEQTTDPPDPEYIAPDPQNVAPDSQYVAPDPQYVAPDPQYVANDAQYVALETKYGPPSPLPPPYESLYVPHDTPPVASRPEQYIADFTSTNFQPPRENHPPPPNLQRGQYHYDPTPGPKQAVSRLSREASLPEIVPLFSRARRRRRRDVLFPARATENTDLYEKVMARLVRGQEYPEDSEDQLRVLVREILSNVISSNQHLGTIKATIKQPRSINPVNYNLNLLNPQDNHHHLGGTVVPSPPHHPVGGGVGGAPVPHPVVTTHELPAPEGCRSIAVKECYQIPIIVPRKIPYEVCDVVPDVDCVTVLKEVPELQCTPEVYRECNDVEKKVPYLEPAEDCVQVTFDECQEIIERVPVELCKRKRVDEDSITLSRGKVERKEGEKRRTPAFRRAVKQTNKKKSSSQTESSSSASASPPVRLTLRDL